LAPIDPVFLRVATSLPFSPRSIEGDSPV